LGENHFVKFSKIQHWQGKIPSQREQSKQQQANSSETTLRGAKAKQTIGAQEEQKADNPLDEQFPELYKLQ
jgi:hypothetical protein